jgi:hypothetical protein
VSREECAADRWLTGQSGAPPDSPMNYNHTPSLILESDEFTRTGLAHRTLSGAPPDSPINYNHTPSLILESDEFTRTGLAHRTLSGAPPDSPMCQTELKLDCTQPNLFQFVSFLLSSVSNT